MEDTFGEEKELVAAKGSGVEAEAAAARPAGCGGGVPGGVVSIPLSSIIFLQLWFTVKIEKWNIYCTVIKCSFKE